MNALAAPVAVAAAYRFIDLADAPALQRRCLASATAAALKGTLLIAPEGINFTLAGAPQALRQWLHELQQDARFDKLDVKLHGTQRQPFQRLKVRLKREIIRMNEPAIRPAAARAPAVDAHTLARWLHQGHCDAGRPLLMLDTRNGFEVDAGAFVGALDWRLGKFSDFPAALAQHASALAGKTVVSYCTGGIRCEKAALWLAQQGVAHVHQLEGGILRYFEALPEAPHWRGRCFVFDERESLDATLHA